MLDNSRQMSEADKAAMEKACAEHRAYLSQFEHHADAALAIMEGFLPKDVRVTVVLRRETDSKEDDMLSTSAMLTTKMTYKGSWQS